MTELIVRGEAFNVLVEGPESAPVLMLSNSLGTNLHMWDRQIAALTEHFQVVRYDSRGHGGSVVTEGPYTIAELGHDAVAIIDALGFDKVHWLGLSKGGMVGQWLLTHRPHRIGRAVLANTAAQIGAPDAWNDRIRIVLEEGMAPIAPAVMERWFTKQFREAHPHEVDKIRAVLEATSPIGYAACCAAIRDMDQLAALPSVKNPVLVIVGRHDPSTPPGMGALIASAIPGAKLVTLDTAHLSNIEETAAFNRAVLDFLTADEAASHHETAAHHHEPATYHGHEAHHGHASYNGHDDHDGHAPHAHHEPERDQEKDHDEAPGDESAAEPAPPPAPKKPRRKPAPKKPAEPVAEAPAAHDEPEPAAEEPAPAPQPAVAKRPARRAPASAPAAPAAPAGRRPAKKAAVKKAAAKKAAAKKARKAVGRGVTRKAATKKAAVKKTATRKAATKKTAARKVTRKTAGKKTTRKIAARKAVTKKTAVKKTATKKKTVVKKSAAKKPLRRAVARRAPARKPVRGRRR